MLKSTTTYLALFLIVIFSACSEETPVDNLVEENALTQEMLVSDQNFQELVTVLKNSNDYETNHVEFKNKISNIVENLDEKYIANSTEADQKLFTDVLVQSVQRERENEISTRSPLPVEFVNKEINFGNTETLGAPVSKVWSTLLDTDSYHEWNLFTPEVETTFEVGTPIVFKVRLSRAFPTSTITQKETVIDYQENEQMCWSANIISDFWFKSSRCIVIEDAGETSVIRNEMNYKGVLAPVFYLLTKDSVNNGFEDLSIGLKARVVE